MSRFSLIPAVLLFATQPILAQGSEGSGSWVTAWSDGPSLTVSLAERFTVHDALTITVTVHRGSNAPMTWDRHAVGKDGGRPRLVVVDSAGQARAIPIPADGSVMESGNANPEPQGVAWSFSLDLRLLFGRLDAGSYTAQMIVPAACYEIRRQESHDLVARKMPFELVDVTIEAVRAAMAAKARSSVTVTLDDPLSAEGKLPRRRRSTATLRNGSRKPILVSGYVQPPGGAPRQVILSTERYFPDGSWRDASPLGWCGTGLEQIRIAPGKSLVIQVGGFTTDGIQRIVVPYLAGEKKGRAVSAPFIQDDLEPAEAK